MGSWDEILFLFFIFWEYIRKMLVTKANQLVFLIIFFELTIQHHIQTQAITVLNLSSRIISIFYEQQFFLLFIWFFI